MPAWYIPAFKAILPHIGIILSAAIPVFTKKKADAVANQALLQQQITELQSAASQNALLIKELAAQLESTVAVLEQAALIIVGLYRGDYSVSNLIQCRVVLHFRTPIAFTCLRSQPSIGRTSRWD